MNHASTQPGGSDQCTVRHPGASLGLGSGRLPCALQAGHEGDHIDAFNRAFPNPDTAPDHDASGTDEPEHAAAWSVASADRPVNDQPHEVAMLPTLDALYLWAGERDARVYRASTDVDGRAIYAAHSGRQSRVAKGPPRERTWQLRGFQT